MPFVDLVNIFIVSFIFILFHVELNILMHRTARPEKSKKELISSTFLFDNTSGNKV
jgi:hypothetical protein